MAGMNQSDVQTDTVENSDLQPLLHEAIDQLTKTDRLCVVMSFLQQKTHAQVAAAIGLSQEAARKRISRSIERMREYLASRGSIVPSAAIGASLGIKHAAVSAAFVQSTLNIAILSHSADSVGAAAAIAKGVSQMIFATKLKIAAALAIALMITGVVTAQAVKILSQSAIAPVADQVQAPQAPAAQPSDVVVDKNVADLGDGVLVEFVGVSPFANDDWHDINGQSINTPAHSRYNGRMTPAPKFKALIRITRPEGADSSASVIDGNERGASWFPGNQELLLIFDAAPGASSVNLQATIADGPWKTVMDMRANPDGVMSTGQGNINISMSPLVDQNGKSLLFASISGVSSPMQIVAIAGDGTQSVGQSQGSSSTSKTNLGGYVFDMQANKIKRLQIQTRKFNKQVTAKNVCLDPNDPTQAQIVVDSR
jgi:hypothetical protein